MNYEEARAFIDRLSVRGTELGLGPIADLLSLLGNPQEDLKFVHVAGTNGKGSVIAFLFSVLKEAGCRVGRYISPTLFSYRERIQLGDDLISREDFAGCASAVARAVDEMQRQGKKLPTAFEAETAIAFLYFKEKACDLVLLEVGMGGRLDATNIIRTPVLTVLTSISMDHMGFLGNTLAEIAWNKAGILKPGVPVASAHQRPEAERVIREEAATKKCPCTFVRPDEIVPVSEYTFEMTEKDAETQTRRDGSCGSGRIDEEEDAETRARRDGSCGSGRIDEEKDAEARARRDGSCGSGRIDEEEDAEARAQRENSGTLGFQSFCYGDFGYAEIPLAGPHQRENAALALECVGLLRAGGYEITDEAVRSGLRKAVWKGRFSVLHRSPLFLIDGAHNPDAALVLRRSLEQYFPDRKKYYIFGVFSDKEYDKIIEITAGLAEHIYTVETPDHPRALPAQELALAVSRVNPSVEAAASIADAVEKSFQTAGAEDVILAFGSLSFLAEAERAVREHERWESAQEYVGAVRAGGACSAGT